MYFSRITLREDASHFPEFWEIFREPYTLHQSVWQLFGDHAGRKRDFLYRLELNGKRLLTYTVSEREPDKSLGLWQIETKPYEPQIRAGVQLAFTLRTNPIRKKNGKRHDIVMDFKHQLDAESRSRRTGPSQAEIAQEEGDQWLRSRAEGKGFHLEAVRVDGYRQHRFFSGKEHRPISFNTLDFNGLLTVTDPDRFVEMLYYGIGPEKGFGCGMMMVRRI